MVRPVIGVAFARTNYLEALRAAGAEVRELSPDSTPLSAALDGLDGLLLTGGLDVRPSLYGAVDCHPTVEINDSRDAYELPLTQAALARRLPVLAICRGVQVLNVAAGGTLIQDLPSARPSTVQHAVPTPRTTIAHRVRVESGSRLATMVSPRLSPDNHLDVNSRHHQAIDVVAPGFVVSATAPDGIIEAIEHSTLPFCMGVQWHPEDFWRTGDAASLFEGLVSAAAQASKTATHST